MAGAITAALGELDFDDELEDAAAVLVLVEDVVEDELVVVLVKKTQSFEPAAGLISIQRLVLVNDRVGTYLRLSR